MNRITKAFADTAARLFFRTGEVTAVTEHGASFRTIEMSGDALQDMSWGVGDKVQVRPDLDGFTTRTYTPVCWDTTRGSTTLLAHMPGTGPGSTWVRTVTAGSPCQIQWPSCSRSPSRTTATLPSRPLACPQSSCFAEEMAPHTSTCSPRP